MNTRVLEDELREKLSIEEVGSLEAFPFRTYSEFLEAIRVGSARLRTRYDSHAFGVLATTAQTVIHYVLITFPFIIGLASVVGALVTSRYILLLGLPLAVLGFLLSVPGVMRGIGGVALLISIAATVYSMYSGRATAACLWGSYATSNLLTNLGRDECDEVFQAAAVRSELVLVWLHLRGAIKVERA